MAIFFIVMILIPVVILIFSTIEMGIDIANTYKQRRLDKEQDMRDIELHNATVNYLNNNSKIGGC